MDEIECHQQNADGTWFEAIPLPFYYGLFPWIWKRFTGWRDEYGRKAQLISWREFSLWENW